MKFTKRILIIFYNVDSFCFSFSFAGLISNSLRCVFYAVRTKKPLPGAAACAIRERGTVKFAAQVTGISNRCACGRQASSSSSWFAARICAGATWNRRATANTSSPACA